MESAVKEECSCEKKIKVSGNYIVAGINENLSPDVTLMMYHEPAFLELEDFTIPPMVVSWWLCPDCGKMEPFLEQNSLLQLNDILRVFSGEELESDVGTDDKGSGDLSNTDQEEPGDQP